MYPPFGCSSPGSCQSKDWIGLLKSILISFLKMNCQYQYQNMRHNFLAAKSGNKKRFQANQPESV